MELETAILAKLEELGRGLVRIEARLDALDSLRHEARIREVETELATLRGKSMLTGGGAGGLVVAVYYILERLGVL